MTFTDYYKEVYGDTPFCNAGCATPFYNAMYDGVKELKVSREEFAGLISSLGRFYKDGKIHDIKLIKYDK